MLTRLLLACALFAAGCKRAPEPAEARGGPDPLPSPVFPEPVATPPPRAIQQAAPAGSPSDAARPNAEDADPTIPSLLAAYRGATDAGGKEDALFELEAVGGPEAGEAFILLAASERDEEIRSLLYMLLAESEAPEEKKIAAFAEGLRPDQPEAVREAAADALETVEDPRALSLWRQYENDPLVGDTAKAALEFLGNRTE